MIDERTVELIHREIDGLNTPEETSMLRSRLPEDPEAQELYEDLVKLGAILKTVAPAEPPGYLKTSILNTIPFRPQPANRTRGFGWTGQFIRSLFLVDHHSLSKQEGSMKKHKAVQFGLLAGVALALVYFAFLYPWPVTQEVQGTIGGVKKYNAGQLTDKDVRLGGPQGPKAHMRSMEKRIKSLEGRLTPDGQTAVLQSRIDNVDSRLAIDPSSYGTPGDLNARIQQAEAEALSKSATLPTEERIADLEAMLFTQTDARTEPLPAYQRTEAVQPDQRTASVQPDQRTAQVQPDQRTASVQPDQRTAQVQPDQRTAQVQPDQRTEPVPAEQRTAQTIEERTAQSIEERTAQSIEERTAQTIEERIDNIESRLNIPPDSRTNQTIEQRLSAAEAEAFQRAASMPIEERIDNLEARIAPDVEARTAILEMRLNNVEMRLNIPPDARTGDIDSRIDNVESRLSNVPEEQRTANDQQQ